MSSQSIYNWEEGKVRPQAKHLPAVMALKTLGRNAAAVDLEHWLPIPDPSLGADRTGFSEERLKPDFKWAGLRRLWPGPFCYVHTAAPGLCELVPEKWTPRSLLV